MGQINKVDSCRMVITFRSKMDHNSVIADLRLCTLSTGDEFTVHVSDVNVILKIDKILATGVILSGHLVKNEQILRKGQQLVITSAIIKLRILIRNTSFCFAICDKPFLIYELETPIDLTQITIIKTVNNLTADKIPPQLLGKLQPKLQFIANPCPFELLDTLSLINPESEFIPVIDVSDSKYGWRVCLFGDHILDSKAFIKLDDGLYVCNDLEEVKRVIRSNNRLKYVIPYS